MYYGLRRALDMETRVDSLINRFVLSFTETKENDGSDLQKLLDGMRETYGLDVVYVMEQMSSNCEFGYTHMSVSEQKYDRTNKTFVFEERFAANASSLFDEEGLSADADIAGMDGEAFALCIQCGFIVNGNYLGGVGFCKNAEDGSLSEERAALQKLMRAVWIYLNVKKAEDTAVCRYQRELTALKNVYSTILYVDLHADSYTTVHTDKRLGDFIPYNGSFTDIERLISGGRVVEKFRQELSEIFDTGYISTYLCEETPSYDFDYQTADANGINWYRAGIVLVDTDEERKPYHILVMFKEITEQKELLDSGKEAFDMLRDAYYRISSVDLNKGHFHNMKIVECDRENELEVEGDYNKVINACARKHIPEEYRDKFLSIMSPENLKAFFSVKREPVVLAYKHLVGSEYQWVQSEIVPLDSYSDTNAHVIWYMKNITDEKAKEDAYNESLLEANTKLRNTQKTMDIEAQAYELVYRNIANISSAEDIRLSIQEMLEDVGKFTRAERVYIFEDRGEYFPNTFEWCANGITPEINNLQEIRPEEITYWTDTLIKGECIVIPDIEKVKNDTPVIYDILKPQDITSVIEAPIMIDNHLIGFLGVDNPPEEITPLVAKSLQVLGAFLAITIKNREEYQNSLQRANDALKKSNAALKDAYEAADRASCAKTDFLSNMSHDIRTPMNAIIGMTAIAGAYIDDKERVQDCLTKITASGKHLLSLINEILDMSRIESGKVTLSEEEFNLSDLIENLLTMVKPQVAEKNHQMNVRIADLEHEDVIGDSLRIQQAFVNIMSNAVKYTPDGGTINLTISERPTNKTRVGCYEFVFEDNGIGMSEEFMEKLFTPFERSDNEYSSKIQGTGLGMAITKNIVNMMNGDIKVKSVQGEGTTFTVTIFLRLQNVDDVSVGELAGLPVLVVDDDEICCQSTAEILKEIGMDSEWVTNGHTAVERVAQRHEAEDDFFAVILDWKMPGMDGLETARKIRRAVGNEVPIIIFSAYDWTDIEMEARAAGVDAFISKPLFKSRLTTLFKGLVGEESAAPKNELENIAQSDYSDKRILLVEDNEINREIAVEILGMTGIKIETAENGKIAVDMVSDSEDGYYNLVFMDIQMPVMNGYDAASAIRSLGRKYTNRLPIIAMTANAFAEDVVATKNAGMNEHIAKPLDMGKLDDAMKRWL